MASEDLLKKAVADPVLEMAQRILDMRDGKAPPLFPRVEGPHSVTIRYGVWEDDLFALATAALQNNTRPAPAATDTGLEIDIEATAENIARSMSNYKNSGRLHGPTYEVAKAAAITALTCASVDTRSQAEELLAAKDAQIAGWTESGKLWTAEIRELQAENAALTARVKELEGINANLMGDDEDKPRYTTKRLKQEIARATEALEAKIASKDVWKELHDAAQVAVKERTEACNSLYKQVNDLKADNAAAEKALESYKSIVKDVCESQRGTKWGKAAECIFDAIERAVRGGKPS